MQNKFGFNTDECGLLRKLNSPAKVQDFVDKVDYNLSEESTLFL